MDSAEKYLKQTESAVIKIFEGIDSYLQILHDSKPPIYVGNAGDTLNQRLFYKSWMAENQPAIQLSLKAQKEFSAESFALATLCGSVLQIAAMGIQWFSKNEEIPENLSEDLYSLIKSGTKVTKFCIGRRVGSLLIGLAIYAGRNQFNHMDEDKLSKLNITIFNLLAHNYDGFTDQSPKDPAFDLENGILINFASNITALLNWRDYKSYYCDMHSLIVTV